MEPLQLLSPMMDVVFPLRQIQRAREAETIDTRPETFVPWLLIDICYNNAHLYRFISFMNKFYIVCISNKEASAISLLRLRIING